MNSIQDSSGKLIFSELSGITDDYLIMLIKSVSSMSAYACVYLLKHNMTISCLLNLYENFFLTYTTFIWYKRCC